MEGMGSDCKYRRVFVGSSAAHPLLCKLIPNGLQVVNNLWPDNGTPVLAEGLRRTLLNSIFEFPGIHYLFKESTAFWSPELRVSENIPCEYVL